LLFKNIAIFKPNALNLAEKKTQKVIVQQSHNAAFVLLQRGIFFLLIVYCETSVEKGYSGNFSVCKTHRFCDVIRQTNDFKLKRKSE
jgi:hypothetical protein